jgi:hypothetical protein
MSDRTEKERADWLDIVLVTLSDHEKRLDAIAERLEKITNKMELYQR